MGTLEKTGYTIINMVPDITRENMDRDPLELLGIKNFASRSLVLDFQKINHIFSLELSVIIRLFKDLQIKGHELYIVNANKSVRNVMSHANIDKIVPIYSTLEELEMEKAFLEVNEAIEGNLGIRIEATDRYTAIALTGGRLSIAFHKDLQQLLTDQLETGCHFIFDCKNLADIDSIGLGLLVEFAKKVQEKKGFVTVIRLNDIISDLFNLFQLNSLIKTFPNIEDAVEFFKEQETGKKG